MEHCHQSSTSQKTRQSKKSPTDEEEISSLSDLKAIHFQLKGNKIKVITKDPHQNKELSKFINRIAEPGKPHLYEPF